MKLVAILLFFAIVGKLSAAPYPYRIGYYRAVDVQPQQQLEEVEADEEDDQDDEPEADISEETDFSNNKFAQDDDDSDEQEEPPNFTKLFPLPQRNSPGHNFPLAIMMSDIQAQGWKVPKGPPIEGQEGQKSRGRNEIELARDDDDDDDDDSDEDEEEEEDDLPDWDAMFPTQDSIDASGPPEGVVDTSSIPSFRSSVGGSRIVYIPARQLRQYTNQYNNRQVMRPQISSSAFSRQYVLRHPSPPRSPVIYNVQTSNQRRPQQMVLASSVRRPQSQVYYMPVRRNSYNPYTSRYVPRYRYYK